MNAKQSLRKLIYGNRRYVIERYASVNINRDRRRELAAGQYPFAAILGCSDSRVPPEIIFDQGLGDLFVVRTAGQAVDSITLGSIEYAVEYLGVRLIVVLGHQDCGAVEAAVAGYPQPGQIERVVKAIQPAVQLAKTQCGNLIANAIIDNIYLGIDKLAASPLLQRAISTEGLKILGAVYCIRNGKVLFLTRGRAEA
jgi:carbonic anhydrase